MPRSPYSNYNDDDISTLSSNTLESFRIYSRHRYKAASIGDGSLNFARRQSTKYFVLASLGFLAAVFLSVNDTLLTTGFINSQRSASELSRSLDTSDSFAAYSTLQHQDAIDVNVERRANEIANYYKNHQSEYNARCDNIMIYMPDAFAFHGHGSQINTYLMAVLVSAYLDRPLLLLEPEGEWNKYEGGSQFGCPDDITLENNYHIDMPGGLSRLIDHPVWLHNGCDIPTCHDYGVWNQMSTKFNIEGSSCLDPASGRDVNAIVVRGSPLRGYMRQMSNEMMNNSNPDVNSRWAMNLGATREEAQRFVEMRKAKDKWDYVIGVMVKSGILRLQPWIARDVQRFLQKMKFPIDQTFDAIHVRRGDKLESESRGSVVDYWVRRGYTEKNMPLNFIPFNHYLGQFTKDECSFNTQGNIGTIEHRIFVATDDPVVVQSEIDKLIAENRPTNTHTGQATSQSPTLLFSGCHQLTFYFNPTQETFFHLGGIGEKIPINDDNCSARYHRNIASIADLFMLARSRTFVGEYNSNWGRVLRVLRTRLTNVDPFSMLLDTRIAWGRDTIAGPGL